jgi:hypothetical protein
MRLGVVFAIDGQNDGREWWQDAPEQEQARE